MGALCFAILLGLAASSSQTPIDSDNVAELLKSPEIESLLKTLAGEEASENIQSSHSSHPRHSHHGKNLNMMNIKNVNVVIKDNNLRKGQHSSSRSKSHKHQHAEQNDESLRSNRCRTTGRCGCNRADGRCDDEDYDIDLDDKQDLSLVINNLQKEVRGEQNPLKNLRCSCNKDQSLDVLRCGCKKRHPDRSRPDDKDDNVQDDDNNDMEIIYLDKNTDLSKSNILNLIRNADKKRDRTPTQAVYGGLVPEVSSEETNNEGQLNVSPQDFFKYYETFKAMATNNLLAYVLHQKNDVDVSKLTRTQQKVVKSLRQVLPQLDKVDILKLRDRLETVIVGDEGPSVVLPHFENNHNIYVPEWVYTNLQSLKSSKTMPTLRKQKLFPLTKQQKEKLNNMIKNKIRVNIKNQKQESKQNRRSYSGILPKHGLPFELQVDGLGQVNP